MSRNTTTPCPGCKQVYPTRATTEVCFDCREKLKFYAELEAEQKGELKRKELAPVGVPGASHWLPYIAHSDGHRDNERLGSQFQTTFMELALGLSEPAVSGCQFPPIAEFGSAERSTTGEPRLMQPGVIRCMRELYALTDKIAAYAHANGHAEGLSLLRKIQSGEISVNDADTRAASVAQSALKKKARAKR